MSHSIPKCPKTAVAARIAARDYGRNLRWQEAQSHDTRGNARFSLPLLQKDGIQLDTFLPGLMLAPPVRVPGTAVFLTADPTVVPSAATIWKVVGLVRIAAPMRLADADVSRMEADPRLTYVVVLNTEATGSVNV
mgnify:CR=1 FL=1